MEEKSEKLRSFLIGEEQMLDTLCMGPSVSLFPIFHFTDYYQYYENFFTQINHKELQTENSSWDFHTEILIFFYTFSILINFALY